MTEYSRPRGARLALAPVPLAPLPAFPPAPAPPTPFVGREREQAQALQLLQDRGVIALTGAHGSGKTALAATICQVVRATEFWIELAPGLNDSLPPLLWQLARPLAHLAPDAWRALQFIEQAGWEYPPIVRLQIILDAYARQQQDILLCIDRLEWSADPALESLLVGLCDYTARTYATRLKLLVIGTTLPYPIARYALPALPGIEPEALRQWADARGLGLSRPVARQIVRQTGGLPQAIALLLDALERTRSEISTSNIMAHPEIRRYTRWLLAGLSSDERSMLEHLSSQNGSSSALSHESLDQLVALEDTHLATLVDNRVVIHPLIRSFHQRDRWDR